MNYFYLFLTGICVGPISSFLGIGGGTIIVPVLYTLYPDAHHTLIIATSLATIFINASINSYHYYKDGKFPEIKSFIIMSVTGAIGSLAGAAFMGQIDSYWAKKIFAAILFLLALKTILWRPQYQGDNPVDAPVDKFKLGIICLVGSFVAAITGIGGGVIFTPMFLTILAMRPSMISSFSNAAMISATGIGLLPYLLNSSLDMQMFGELAPWRIGNINYAMALLILLGTLISAKWGVKLNNKVSSLTKQRILAVYFFIISIKIFLS